MTGSVAFGTRDVAAVASWRTASVALERAPLAQVPKPRWCEGVTSRLDANLTGLLWGGYVTKRGCRARRVPGFLGATVLLVVSKGVDPDVHTFSPCMSQVSGLSCSACLTQRDNGPELGMVVWKSGDVLVPFSEYSGCLAGVVGQ